MNKSIISHLINYMKKDKKTIVIAGIAVLVLVGLSFWSGRMTAPKIRGGVFGQMGQTGQMGQRNGQNNQRAMKDNEIRVMGKIEKIEDKQLVVKTIDGSTKIVLISESTAIKKMAEGNFSDIVVGQEIMVGGKQDSGVMVAESLEISGNIQPR